MVSTILLASKALKLTKQSYTHPFNFFFFFFFMLLTEKHPEIFLKHKGHFSYFRIICFELIYFCNTNKKNYCSYYNSDCNKILYLVL